MGPVSFSPVSPMNGWPPSAAAQPWASNVVLPHFGPATSSDTAPGHASPGMTGAGAGTSS